MTKTTRAQREALKRVFQRAPLAIEAVNVPVGTDIQVQRRAVRLTADETPITYRQFRALAQPTYYMDDAIVLPWCGMWLCIERDGYTHS